MSKSRNLEPIISHVVLQLSDLGIQSTSASFQISKLQSSHFLCAHEKEAETNNVTMMDLANSNKVVRYTTIADSAIIHPYSYVIAMRGEIDLRILGYSFTEDSNPPPSSWPSTQDLQRRKANRCRTLYLSRRHSFCEVDIRYDYWSHYRESNFSLGHEGHHPKENM
ncbi:hypothetical protein FRC03_007410 [Tulasnella sp. 419]|nr:hypothetical protein FRC03_007410 [Tulasnella sp. 419]